MDDLARSMSLNVSKVWLITEDSEVQVGTDEIKPGDRVRIHMGTVIPFDGIVTEGEAMVNEASLTGNPCRWQNMNPVMYMPERLWRKVNLPFA
mgnify:CR=1 FL=1